MNRDKLINWVGIDDAGRGALAGPLVIAGFYHPVPDILKLAGVKDSKSTNAFERKKIFKKITAYTDSKYWVAIADPGWIDEASVNTAEAIKIRTIVGQTYSYFGNLAKVGFLIDGGSNYANMSDVNHEVIPKGDLSEPLISAASIVAKYYHDNIIGDIASQYPEWKFESHRGYASPHHKQMLYSQGPLPGIHRMRAATTSACSYALKNGFKLPSWSLKVKPYYDRS